MTPIIQLQGISAGYGKREVLKHISLDIQDRDFLAIVGPNGSGKTTLAKIILGLHTAEKGNIRFFRDGQQVERFPIGYLPQYSKVDKKFPISVKEIILSGCSYQKSMFSRYKESDFQEVQKVMDRLGINYLKNRHISELSGGQLQRVYLGRAIVAHPQAIVLDEPNTYLDREGENKLYQLLEELNKETAIILISHDETAVRCFAKRIVRVNETLKIVNKN